MEIVAYRCVWDSGWQQYHDKTDPLPTEWDDAPDEVAALVMKIDADHEIGQLRDGIERCYRMLLSEPNTKGALFKAENILRELLVPNEQGQRRRQASAAPDCCTSAVATENKK